MLLTSAASVSGGVEFIGKARAAVGAKKTAFWVVALGAFLAGGLILDGSSVDESPKLVSLTSGEAERLGLTADEHAAYEFELPMINALNEEVLLRIDQQLGDSHPSDLEIATKLHRNWQELAQFALSPESMRAIQKIGAGL